MSEGGVLARMKEEASPIGDVCMHCGTGLTHEDDVLIALHPEAPRSHGLHEGRCETEYLEGAMGGAS